MFELESIEARQVGQVGAGVCSGWMTSSRQQSKDWSPDNMWTNASSVDRKTVWNCYMCFYIDDLYRHNCGRVLLGDRYMYPAV